MNLHELDALIASLKAEVTDFDNAPLIRLYEKARIGLVAKINAQIASKIAA